jgi:hypothetical protein
MLDNRKDRSLRQALMDQLRRIVRKKQPPEGDPYAYVTAPLHRGPKGRSGSAVAEIEDDSFQSFSPRGQ